MPPVTPSRIAPDQSLSVFAATDLRVSDGANMGDTLSFADELGLDDCYELAQGAALKRLSVIASGAAEFTLTADTPSGAPGAKVHLDCALTLMASDGQPRDALVLVEVDGAGNLTAVYLLPLAALRTKTEYKLIGIDRARGPETFAHVACVSFTRGTHITLGSGAQCAIEDLRPGNNVLTRDDGVQEIRWIGRSTLRATGAFAPIRITAGTLNNTRDLLVSPNHRLFFYQRSDALGAGRSELLIKARHLLNGQTVTTVRGGFIDYFQLLFDSHQIVYAEGIAAESMLIDTATKPILPADLSAALGDVIPGHSDRPHAGLDVNDTIGPRGDLAELLRRASMR